MATRLDNLSIEEVSGVDSPANETPGWLVMKSHDIDTLERSTATLYAALAGADQFLEGAPEDVVKARDTLEGFLEEILTDEPQRETLVSKVRAMFRRRYDGVESAPTPTPTSIPEAPIAKTEFEFEAEADDYEDVEVGEDDDTLYEEDDMDGYEQFEDEPVAKAAEVDALRDVLSAVLDRMENIEKALAGPTALRGQEDRGAPVEKASGGGTLHDAIVSAARGNRVTIQ